MKKPTRILILEDAAPDADLAQQLIRQVLKRSEFDVVGTRKAFLASLKTFQPDVILADYSLPRFNGMQALKIARKHAPLTPLIIWTGSINEDVAVDCMKAGARDYLLKDNLQRLGPAVMQALEERQLLLERKLAEERYQAIFENSADGIFQSTPEGRYVNVNPALAKMYGYESPQDLIESVVDIASQVYLEPGERAHFMEVLEKQGIIENYEQKNRCKNGEVIWTSTSARPVRDAAGDLLYIEGFVHNITARKLMEERLRESQSKYRTLVEQLPAITYISGLDQYMGVSYISPQIESLGFDVEEWLADPELWFKHIHPADQERVLTALETFRAGGESFRVEYRLVLPDGQTRWLDDRSAYVRNQHGEPIFRQGFMLDITERKQAEEALQRSEFRFRALIENGLDDISLLAADGTLLWESPSTVRNLGYQSGEFVGRNIFEIMHPDDRGWTSHLYSELIKEPGSRQRGTFRLRHSDGAWRWVEALVTNMLDEPSVNAIVVNYRDITKRWQAEDALKEERNLLRTLIDNLPDRIYAMDTQGRKILSNTADWQAAGGKTMEDVIGKTDFDTYPPDLAEDFWQLDQAVLEAGTPLINHEEPGLDTEGKRVSILTTKIPLRDEKGKVIGLVGIGRDITERKQVEARLNDLLAFNEKILNHSPLGILTYKFTGECVFANMMAASIVGASVEQLQAQNFHTIDSWKTSGLYDLVQRAIATGLPATADIHHHSTFGQDVWITAHCITFHSKDEAHLLLTITEITDRKLAEEKLLQSESRYRLATKATDDVIWEWNPETNQLFWSGNAAIMFGYTPEEIAPYATWWDERLHPDDYERVVTNLNKLIEGDESMWLDEYRFLRRDGSYAHISDRGYVERDESGRPLRLIGAMSDITQRKQAEIERQALLEIMQGLADTNDLDELLKLIHQSIANVIYARNFFVVLHQAHSGLFEEIYSVDQYDLPEPPSRLEKSITSYVYRSGEPLLLTQSRFDELAAQGEVKLVGTNSKSWLGVPLKTSGRTIGVMAVQDYASENRYSERDRDFLVSIAAQIALVIERKQAEEALREREEHYRAIFEGVQDAILVESTDGRILMVNERACEMFGYSRAEFLRKTISDLVPDGHPILRTGGSVPELSAEPRETVNRRANGETFPIEISGRILIINGETVELIVIRDITERKQTEELLHESEERFSNAFEYAPIGMALVAPDGRWLRVNRSLCELVGYSPQELLSITFQKITHPDDLEADLQFVRQMLAGEIDSYQIEKRYFHKLGHPIWILLSISLIYDQQGNPRYFIAQIQDITKRKQAETALQESATQFRTLFEASPDAIMLIDQHGDWPILDCNTAACEMNGYTREELIGQPIDILNAEPSTPPGRAAYLEQVREAGVLRLETAHRRKDGTVFLVDISTTLITLGGREIILGIDRDITERKRAEQALLESMAQFRTLFEASPDAIVLIDPTGDWPIIDCNTAACQMNGYTSEEMIGQPIEMLNVVTIELERRAEYLESIRQAGVLHFEELHRRKDGSLITVDIATSLIQIGNRDIILRIDRDITERKRAEAAEREQRAMAEALRDTAETLNSTLDYGEVLDHILAAAGRVVPHDAATIMLIDGEAAQVVRLQGYDKHGFDNEIRGIRLQVPETTNLRQMFETRRPVVITDTHSYPGWKRFPSTEWLRSSVGAPISIYGEVIGFICLDGQQPEFFTPVHAERLQAFANQAALAIHNARLLQQAQVEIAERKQAEEELRASEERFRQLADNIQEGFWITDARTGEEIYMSPAVEKIWGRPIKYLRQAPNAFINTVFSEDQPALLQAIEKEKNGESVDIEYRILHPDGSLRWVWDRAFPIFDEKGQVIRIAGISADITERRESELALVKSQSRYRELFDSSPISLWEEDFSLVKEQIDLLLTHGITDFNHYFSSHPERLAELASLVRVNDANQAALELYGTEQKEDVLRGLTQILSEDALSHFQEELLGLVGPSRRFVWEGTDRMRNGRQLEVLVTGSIPHGYEDDWSKVIVSVSDITERRRAEEEVRRRAEETAALLETSLALTDLDLNTILRSISSSAKDLFAADGCRIFLMEPDNETLRCVLALQENSEAFSELSIKLGEGVTGAVAVTGQAEIVNEMQNDPRAVEVPGTPENEAEAIMFAPLKEREHTIGVLSIRRSGRDRHFHAGDLDLLEAFAAMAASAVSNARLFEETQRRLAELEALHENSLAVGRLLEPRQIGERIIETFARYLRWHHVAIRLKQEESDDLELVAFNLPDLDEAERSTTEQHFVAHVNKVGQGLSGWAIQTGQVLRTGNVNAHPQYVNTHSGIQSGLYMPLKAGERVIGVISVESEVPDAFTEQDERLLATLASQAAIAFENARLYETIRKELAERRRAEDALRVSEAHYRELADSITDILFELDHEMHYTHWNKASEALTGDLASYAIGKSMRDIFGESDEQARMEAIFREVLSMRQPRTFETAMVSGGTKRSFEVNAYPSRRGVSVVAKDVTDRKRTETIMQKRFELMEYSANHTLSELIQRTVDEVSALTGSTIGFLHIVEPDQRRLGLQVWSTNALKVFNVPVSEGAHRPLDQAGLWAEAVHQRQPLIQNDYASLPPKTGLPPGHAPIVREMVIPIIRSERLVAVMGIANKPQDYTSHDLELAARLADYAWDITERKQMEVALEMERTQLVQRVEARTADLSRANSNLARALRVKDEFLANMSHELRTPLNAILGLSESLAEQIAGPLNEKQQKYITTIGESGHHLLALINDILDLAKIEAGQITLDINKVDIYSVCQASLRMVRQLAQKKNQEVALKIEDGLGLMWADERRLKQMIVNLLGNAVKFTPENGKIGLEVHGDEEANKVTITVWDTGIGIKPEDLERLFQPFVQLDSGLARETTGTGLGLALVAQMARLHGGSVNAFSEPGTGSRFSIVLPWEPAMALDSAARLRVTAKFPAIRPDETRKPTILLVEDTKEVIMMIQDYLELAGYKIVTAQDGVDAIVQAKLVHPDLILMDVQMPRMDGMEATRKLRSEPDFRYTPIIALTALAMPNDRERCLAAGMDEYISKPINLKALVKIIQTCLFNTQERSPQ